MSYVGIALMRSLLALQVRTHGAVPHALKTLQRVGWDGRSHIEGSRNGSDVLPVRLRVLIENKQCSRLAIGLLHI
jgi:hypothetical protein